MNIFTQNYKLILKELQKKAAHMSRGQRQRRSIYEVLRRNTQG